MKLIFIRHGEPNYKDDTVTPQGRREAEALSPRVLSWQADRFFCSPLGRAQDTAKIALQADAHKLETLEWLREFHIEVDDPETGERRIPWDFMPDVWTNYEELYDRKEWVNSPVMQTGEIASRQAIVAKGIDELLASFGYFRKDNYYITEQGNEQVLVFFCHLGVQFVILSHLLGVSAPVLWQNFFVATTSVTVVETEERNKGKVAFRCKKVGDTSHLYVAGIEPSIAGFFEPVYGKEIKKFY